ARRPTRARGRGAALALRPGRASGAVRAGAGPAGSAPAGREPDPRHHDGAGHPVRVERVAARRRDASAAAGRRPMTPVRPAAPGASDVVGAALVRDRRRVLTDLVVLTKPRVVVMVLVT